MLKKICIYLVLPTFFSLASFIYVRTRPPPNIIITKGVAFPVSIERDRLGIPTISAKNLKDAEFGLGYAMAQDRLWQLDMTRRLASGKLSEILGLKALELDKFMRNIKIPRLAERDLKHTPNEVLEVLRAFVAGVNEGAKDQWLPLEYYITGSNWQPYSESEAQALVYLISISLSISWGNDLLRNELEKFVGESTYYLHPTEMHLLRPLAVIISDNELAQELKGPPENLPESYYNATFHSEVDLNEFGSGSNSWIISGKHTKSGKPIYAVDPHLNFNAPSIWYLAHVNLPEDTFSGAFMVPSPMLSAGRNKRFVWGSTSLKSDDIDIFVEKIKADKYLYGDSYLPLSYFEEVIHIKGNEPITFKFKETLHGPILEDSVLGAKKIVSTLPGYTEPNLAFCWSAYNFPDNIFETMVKMTDYQTIYDLRKGLKKVTAVKLAMLIGSVDGDIYLQTTGRAPIRSTQGNKPIPGWLPNNTWKGFIPYEEMPYLINPEKGYIVSANNFPVDSSYKYFESIGRYFSPGRAERITELIEEKLAKGHKFTAKDSIEMQKDELDIFAREGVPTLLTYLKDSGNFTKEIQLMKAWDYVMSRDSKAAAIYAAWFTQILKNLLADKVPENVLKSAMKSLLIQLGFLNRFASFPQEMEILCDNRNTPEKESCEELITKSFIEACRITNGKSWGELHLAKLPHIPFSEVPLLKGWFELRTIEVGGLYSTIHSHQFDWSKEGFDSIHGPTLKIITDLGNEEENYWAIQSGMGGSPFVPHYADMYQRFHYGDLEKFTYQHINKQ